METLFSRLLTALYMTVVAVGPFTAMTLVFVGRFQQFWKDFAGEQAFDPRSNPMHNTATWLLANSAWFIPLTWVVVFALLFAILGPQVNRRRAWLVASLCLFATLLTVIFSMYMPMFNLVNVIQEP